MPAPQISDTELEEVVKLGIDIHGDLSATPSQTPLRDQLSATPSHTSLRDQLSATPSRTLSATPRTPLRDQFIATPSQTPLRDQLSINPENALDSLSDVSTIKQQQSELRAHLKTGLGSLPAPRNDFEIVLPENEVLNDGDAFDDENVVEDASEVEERIAQRKKAEGKYAYRLFTHNNLSKFTAEREWRSQSQTVQRSLPRPTDVNTSILRGAPHKDQKYRELYKVCMYASEALKIYPELVQKFHAIMHAWQVMIIVSSPSLQHKSMVIGVRIGVCATTITLLFQAEEMIKIEMLKMLRNDLIKFPYGQVSKTTLAKIKADSTPYKLLPEEEMQQVHIMLHIYTQCMFPYIIYNDPCVNHITSKEWAFSHKYI